LRAVCEHPLPKGPRGSLWLAKATESRHHLTEFWQTFRKTALENRKRVAPPTDETFPALVRRSVAFDVSRDHLTRVVAEHKQIMDEEQRLQNIAASKQADATEGVSFQQSTWGKDGASEEPVKERSSRTKTHRTTSDEGMELLRVGLEESQVAEPTTKTDKLQIGVKKESLDVFNKMFCSAELASVRWIRLIQALTDAGLTALQNSGSGVKSTSDQGGSIVLDKPHPEPVVDPVMLRRAVGKRLNDAFGWDAENFVLRKKEQKPDEAG
jgi:hypothetical protein